MSEALRSCIKELLTAEAQLRQEQEAHESTRQDLARELRTMKFQEESYLAEHQHWGECKWRKATMKKILVVQRALRNKRKEDVYGHLSRVWIDTAWAASDIEQARNNHPKELYRVIGVSEEDTDPKDLSAKG